MGDGYNFQQLKKHILPLSGAAAWEVVVKEWSSGRHSRGR